METKHIIMIIAAIVVVIIIIVIVVVMTSSTSSTSSTLPTPPQTLTITWLNNKDDVIQGSYIPENAIYTLTLGTSLESYNSGISDMMSSFVSPLGFTVKYIYEITGDYPDVKYFDISKVVFIKYVDSDGLNRFALVSVVDSNYNLNAIIRTTDDVGTLIDPTKYTGTWLSSNNLSTEFVTNETLRIS